ncbi:unnamed protein product [Fusarium graminearum]|nr:unnamed protein product [Fusarium graminearum]
MATKREMTIEMDQSNDNPNARPLKRKKDDMTEEAVMLQREISPFPVKSPLKQPNQQSEQCEMPLLSIGYMICTFAMKKGEMLTASLGSGISGVYKAYTVSSTEPEHVNIMTKCQEISNGMDMDSSSFTSSASDNSI